MFTTLKNILSRRAEARSAEARADRLAEIKYQYFRRQLAPAVPLPALARGARAERGLRQAIANLRSDRVAFVAGPSAIDLAREGQRAGFRTFII